MELDNKLYNDYFNGDKEAFSVIYNKYKEKIKYFIYNIVHDYQKAEDLTQETFIYVMQNKMKESCNFKYYIYLKAKSLALNFLNTENRRNEIRELYLVNDNEKSEKDILECILNEENKKELIESINCLDEKYKNAIYLTKIEGLSYLETSKILDESIQNTKQIVHKGKNQLRKILIRKGFDEMSKVAKVLIIMIIATTFIGGIVYAVSNIKISEKPIFEWFKVNFSDEYENYREEVQGEIIQAPSESSIELVSTVCDEGFVILEFDIKLSEEDKKHLKIGEPILTEEYINATDDRDSNTLTFAFNEETKKVIIDEETGQPVQITIKQSILDMYGDKKIDDSLYVGCDLKPGAFEDSPIIQHRFTSWVIIDGEYIYIRPTPQSVKQISEYEYKLHQMYFLTDEELGDKTEFTITMKDFIITTKEMQYGDEDTCLKFDGQFDIELSKEKALENSKKIEPNCEELIVDYGEVKMTQRIDSVIMTPLQTLVKVTSRYENLNYYNTFYEYLKKRFRVLDENGKEINSENFETKWVGIYPDGFEETWGVGNANPSRSDCNNVSLEVTTYIIIENKKDNSKLKLILQEGSGIKKIEYEDIGSYEIDLTNE